jgi:hypothetical protein
VPSRSAVMAAGRFGAAGSMGEAAMGQIKQTPLRLSCAEPCGSGGHLCCRYDLHHAIMLHGGYAAAAQLLDRRPAWPPSQHLDRCAGFLRQRGLLPSGRSDACQRIDLTTRSCVACALPRSLSTLHSELRAFVSETGLPRGRLPTASQLLDAGRGDLLRVGMLASHVPRACCNACD